MAVDAPGTAEHGLPEATQRALAQLRRQFVASLPTRMEGIRDAVDAAARAQAVHRLIGAAGSYGFTAISQAARAVDALTTAPDDFACQAACVELQRCVDEVCKSAGDGGSPDPVAPRASDTKP